MNNIIIFLEEKGANKKTINRVLTRKLSEEETLKKLNYIYNIFESIGLNENEITLILENNGSLFNNSYEEILKIAYVIKNAGIEKDIFENQSLLGNINLYTRIYIRNKTYENSGINFKGTTILLDCESRAFDVKYNLSSAAKKKFKRYCICDNDLINIYGKDAYNLLCKDRIYKHLLFRRLIKNNIDVTGIINNSDLFKIKEISLDLQIEKEARNYFRSKGINLNIEKLNSGKSIK